MITPGAAVQSSYTQYQPVASVGMPATTSGWDVDTRIADDPVGTAGIGFGLAVCQATLHGDKSAALGQLSGSVFVGITRADPTQSNLTQSLVDHYLNGDNMPVFVRGDVWVAPKNTVLAGGAVYYNSSTGELGSSSISNAVLIANAKWMTSYPITGTLLPTADLAIVRLGAAPD